MDIICPAVGKVILALIDRGNVDDLRKQHVVLHKASQATGINEGRLMRNLLTYADKYNHYPTIYELKQFIVESPHATGPKGKDDLVSLLDEIVEYKSDYESTGDIAPLLDALSIRGRECVYRHIYAGAIDVLLGSEPGGKQWKGRLTDANRVDIAREYVEKSRKMDWGLPSLAPEGEWTKSGDQQIECLKEGLKSGLAFRCRTGNRHIDDAVAIGPGHSIRYVGILGFSNHGKSMAARAWAYNMAVGGKKVLFVALEDDARNTWMQFSWLHAHERPDLDIPEINRWKTKPGTITQRQWDDLEILMDEVRTKINGEIKVVTHRKWADIENELKCGLGQEPYDVLVVDYIQHLSCDDPRREVEETRATFAAAQALAKDYHGGRGLVVITPLQANKDGEKRADAETDDDWGVFPDLGCVERYTDAARDMDLIIGVWSKATMRDSCLMKISCLKSREQFFPNHLVRVNRRTRRLIDIDGKPVANHNVLAVQDEHDRQVAIQRNDNLDDLGPVREADFMMAGAR